ncbi:MAG: YqcI/YcgG family protein [Actinomycetota bacterium]|nr:YqcI/YcgG family protein [Actinomycetota bacterium]
MPVERSVGGRWANPFSRELARANSSRAVLRGKKLVRTPLGEPATPLQEFVHDSFRALVLNPAFSCVGAKSAVRRGSYNFGLYAEMSSPGSTAGLARDLFGFVGEQDDLVGEFSTFVACFEGPVGIDEEEFERLLWAQLQRLHEEDRHHHRWDASVSPDPGDSQFAFSFAGRAFFVVGLHSASSRFARRFAWPTLVFNAHHQFERLRGEGRYARVQDVIRDRERNLQGSLNPNLADFGTRSEARQYSGRPVEEGWRCPFHALEAEHPHRVEGIPGYRRED